MTNAPYGMGSASGTVNKSLVGYEDFVGPKVIENNCITRRIKICS